MTNTIKHINEPLNESAPTFGQELVGLINRHSIENRSNTPDWILADYILGCLRAFDMAVHYREEYHGRPGTIGVSRNADLEQTMLQASGLSEQG